MRRLFIVLLAAWLGISACGVDRGGAPAPGVDRGGFFVGPISGFGSIIVNGIRFETDAATIVVDGQNATEADLAVGQIVTITGELDADGSTGVADTVVFEDNVEGPIESIDVAASRFIVLGQPVFVDEDTSFSNDVDPSSLEGLVVGDVVEVSGFVDPDGAILATRVERQPEGGEFEVTGTVMALDAANFLFDLGSLVVDYSGATLEGFPGGQPANGDLVEAKGMDFGLNGELLALTVELKNAGLPGGAGDEGEVQGIVTRFVSITDFDVAGQAVSTDAETIYEDGEVTDIALGIRVEVEGEFDGNGVLVADKINIKLEASARVEAPVEAVAADGGELTILNVQVTTDSLTRFEDKSQQALASFGMSDIGVDDFVNVRGFQKPGYVAATRVERVNSLSKATLRGVVETVDDPSFTILDVVIQTNASTEFKRKNDKTIAASEFFAQALGTLVKVKGQANGNIVAADEVKIDDSDSDSES